VTSVELRRWVMIAGIALIALIIGADSYEAWADYRRVMADNQHLEMALSRAVSEQTARMIQTVDVLLSSYVADDRGRQMLLGQMTRLPFVHSGLVTDGDGRVIAATRSETLGETLQDSDAFTVPRAGGDTLYIDRPDAAVNEPRTFAVSRRIESHGGFAGVVVARIAFDYLARFYAQIDVTPDTSIRLMRDDGVTLAQYPTFAPEPPAHSPPGGKIQVAEQISGYPIKVVVSRSSGEVLQPWIQEEESSAARTLSLSVLAGILLLALYSALNRQERIDREKLRLEHELAAIQRVEALGFLAASVAHDFNNVLTAIIGYAELAGETAAAASPAQQNIDRLLAATERARLLVRRVLTFDPRRSVRYRPTSVGPIVLEVAEQVRATLPPAVEMHLHGLDQSVFALGDPTEMYQVVMNLCSNAVHAMPKGGSLEVRLETLDIRESESLALGELQPGRWARLSVVDTGIGLADEQTMSIFEPFYTTRSTAHGTGIGLTVVRNIILRMHGALDVSSRLGMGTRMAVYWPITEPPVSVPRLVGEARTGAGETIMVVDDERELVVLTEELLASLSYEPVGFSDARAALEAFKQDPQRFDAILTDERMQPMGGLEFAHAVHRIEPGLPIILMTAHRDSQIDARAAAEGILEILDKPVRVQTLREALGRALKRAEQLQPRRQK
jgi:signal transduction histidine kinase/ActR/RegA family two-component response regulator